jgi:hypothetical protein
VTEYPGEEQPVPAADPDTQSQPEGPERSAPDYETEPSREGSHPLVEETMERLGDLRDRPVSEHAEVYADIHERLQAALAESEAEHVADHSAR